MAWPPLASTHTYLEGALRDSSRGTACYMPLMQPPTRAPAAITGGHPFPARSQAGRVCAKTNKEEIKRPALVTTWSVSGVLWIYLDADHKPQMKIQRGQPRLFQWNLTLYGEFHFYLLSFARAAPQYWVYAGRHRISPKQLFASHRKFALECLFF